MVGRLLKIILVPVLALISILVVMMAIMIGTETGRVWLAQTGLSLTAAGFDGKLEWQGIRSPDLNHWQLDSLTIARPGTGRAYGLGINVRWQPLMLFSGRLVLDELTFKRLAVETSPGSTGTANETGKRVSTIPVSIRSFSIDTLVLPLPADDSGELRITGDMEVFSGDSLLAANLRAGPVAGDIFKLTLSLQAGWNQHMHYSGWYSETPKGPVSLLLKLPQDEPFETSFDANLDHGPEGYRLAIKDFASRVLQHDIVIRGTLQQDGSALVTEALNIDVDESEHVLKGRINRDGLDLTLDLAGLPLDLASHWTGASVNGSVGGQITIRGSYDDPVVVGNLNVKTTYRDIPLQTDLDGTANRERLLVERSVISTGNNILVQGKGRVDFADGSVDLDAALEAASLDQIREFGLEIPATLGGHVDARATIHGPWGRPDIDVQGKYTGHYKDTVPLNLNITAATTPPPTAETTSGEEIRFDVAIRTLDLQVREHQITGQGHVVVSTKPWRIKIQDAHIGIAGSSNPFSGEIKGDQLALNLTLDAFPLDILAPLIEVPVAGVVSGDVFLGGTITEPQLHSKVSSDLTLRQLPMHLEGEFDGSRKWLVIRRLKVTGDAGTLTSHGLVDLTGDETSLDLKGNNIDLSLLRDFDQRIPDDLDGQVRADLSIKGSWSLPEVSGEGKFTGKYREVPLIASVEGRGNRKKFNVAALDMTAGDKGRLVLKGSYDDSRGADFTLTADKLPVQLFRLHDRELPPGAINAGITIKGTKEIPDARGRISYVQSQQPQNEAQVLSAVDADLALTRDQFHINMKLAGENARTGNIEISLPWRRYLQQSKGETLEQLPIAGTINSEAYLQEICALLLDTDMHDCKGEIQANLTMSNTLEDPRFEGTVILNNGSYENKVSGTSLHDVHLNIKAAGNRLQIVKATAGAGDRGVLELEGRGQWQDNIEDLDVNLVLHARDAHLLRRYDMDGTANGALTLTGNLKEMFLSGTLEIQPFTLALETLLQEDIPTLKVVNDDTRSRMEQASRQRWESLPAINLNVELRANQQAFLRGQGLEAELQGKVQIQGTYPDTVYRGNFKTVRGNVSILGKKFELVGGDVRLEDEVFSLLIPAVYKGKDIEVRAELSGTVDQLHLDLSSSPVYPEDEIVSRLLFNKSSQNISPLQAVRLANAISVLKFGGKPLFDPLNKIQKTLAVDTLSVEDAENGNGVTLGVGKYIHEKVYVEMETGTGAGEPWQGNIQIELLPNLNLENSINGETGFGNVELQWKKDY